MRRWLQIIWLGLLLALNCAPAVLAEEALAPDQVSLQQAHVSLERALEHYRAGKLNEAAGLLRGFLVGHRDSPLVDVAFQQLARIHAELGEPGSALNYLTQVSPSAQTASLQLLQADLLLQSGKVDVGQNLLAVLDTGALTLAEQQDYWLVSAEAARLGDQPQRALYFLYRGLFSEGQMEPVEVLGRIRSLMDDQLTSSDLAEASFMYRETPVGYLAMLQLGWRALAAGERELAQKWTSAVLAGPPGFAYRDEALSLQGQLVDPTQVQRAIGVLLPLSGRYAAFGELVQRGMELARETFRPALPVRFVYLDSAADPEQTDRQMAELAIGERVMAVIGPLVGTAAETAAARANQLQVPLLTLSQRDGLAATGPYVFRNSLTSDLQVRTLVDLTMGELGLTQFGILHPETRQGIQLANRFQDEVLRRGGELVDRQSYHPDQTDFRRQVRLLQGLDPDAPDEEEEPAPELLPGEELPEEEPPPFQALFIPDYVDRVGLLAPQLEFYGLKGIQLLGTNGWNDAELIRVAGQFVEGAIFVDGFFRHSPYPFVQEFASRYFERYQAEPTILEAQGYDAAGIMLNLMGPGVRNREALRQGLRRLSNYPGVTGATRFNFQGEAEKILFLLQIQDGTIVQIN